MDYVFKLEWLITKLPEINLLYFLFFEIMNLRLLSPIVQIFLFTSLIVN